MPDALGVNDDELPHDDGKPAYAIRVLITNIPAPGEGRKDGLGPKAMAAQAVLKLLNGRCGDSERAHDALKNGLAGGTMPSGRFGANAAWWLAALLAHNLHTLTAWWSLDARATWKRIRRVLLVHAGRLIESGRQLDAQDGHRRTGLRSRTSTLDLPCPADAGLATLPPKPPDPPCNARMLSGIAREEAETSTATHPGPRHGAERSWINRESNHHDQRPPQGSREATKLKNHSKCQKSIPEPRPSPI